MSEIPGIRHDEITRPARHVWRMLFAAAFILCCLVLTAAQEPPNEFGVTGLGLKPDEAQVSGPCPILVKFTGYITTNGPGTVKYTFTRSDGATGPIFTLDFKAAGTQPVSTTWALGDAVALPSYAGWQTLKMVFPNKVESKKAEFSINCGTTDEKQRTPAPQPSTGRIRLTTEGTQTGDAKLRPGNDPQPSDQSHPPLKSGRTFAELKELVAEMNQEKLDLERIGQRFEEAVRDLEKEEQLGDSEIQRLMAEFDNSRRFVSGLLDRLDETARGARKKIK